MSPTLQTDMELEVIVLPVADVDIAKRFYERLGWRLDADFGHGSDFRIVQFTPPGSACAIHFGIGVTSAVPHSGQKCYLVVSDIVVAHAELQARGIPVSEIVHREGALGTAPVKGLHPLRQSYASFATFEDPDGNSWLVQEITQRLPGRAPLGRTTFNSSAELAAGLRRAEAAHGLHEERIGARNADWSQWYANYLAAEQAGTPLPAFSRSLLPDASVDA